MSETKSEAKSFLDAKGKAAVCEGCKAPVVGKFCPECGTRTLDDAGKVVGNDGWGPGSKVTRQMKIPVRFTAFGTKITPYINGQKFRPGSMRAFTFDDFSAIRQMILARAQGDFNSVHGEPGKRKVIDRFLGTLRGSTGRRAG